MHPNSIRCAMMRHARTNLADVTLRHLQSVAGRTFHTRDSGGRRISLKLISVTDMRPRRRLPPDLLPSIQEREGVLVAVSALGVGSVSIAIGSRPIGLLFVGPSQLPLADACYDLELPWLTLPGLHLSSLGEAAETVDGGVLYESIID